MKIICVGRNYGDHIKELENKRPSEPVLFLKPDTSLILKNQPFFIPDFSNNVQYEVEVLIKINRIGKHIQSKFSYKYYDQIGLGIDFTARDIQNELKEKGLPWEKAKGFDGSAMVGSWVKKSNFTDINNLSFQLQKNNQMVQQASTESMIWKIDELIAYISQFFTLKIGDIIFTGTPSGVGQVASGDQLTGFLENQQLFSLKIK